MGIRVLEGICFAQALATLVVACVSMRLGAESRGASDTHLLASFIVFLVFFMVSFAFVSLIVIMSLRTVTTSVVDGMHSMSAMHGDRTQRRRRACLQRVCEPDVPAAGRPTVGQWPVTRARQQPSFLT